MKNLILPVAGLSSRYPNMRPKWLITMPDGKLMVEKSVSKFNLKIFKKIYLVALKDHLNKYVDKKKLIKSLKKNISKKIQIIELDKPTTCQAETVYKAINKAKIKGGIVVKDCDNIFKFNFSDLATNEIMVLNLNQADLIEAKSKSYVTFNKLRKVTNIVEKKVISNFFCCGAYSFKSSNDFIKYSRKLLSKSKDVFISHVIYEMMLNNKIFRYKEVSEYIDWGTIREFRNWQRKHITIFSDFDGCLVLNGSKFGKKGYRTESLKENLITVSKIIKTGLAELIITTSRPDYEKKYIISLLKKFDIKPKYVLTNLLHAKRYLINDFSETNPFPSSVAINLERDSNKLSSILRNLII